jgi:hypothetical protein
MDNRESKKTVPSDEQFQSYEPPRVERVLSPDDLHREVLYAGVDGGLSRPP